MESYKKTIKEKEMSDALEHIFQNAMGNPIIFDSAPTKTQMNANSWGIYSTDLYVRFANGTCLKFAGVNVS